MRFPSRYFRAGVGAVILNHNGEVLGIERAKNPGAWQLSQGGLEAGEEPTAAALREIEEETGLRPEQLEMLAAYPEPLVYELPAEYQNPKTGMGQVQYWFFFRAHDDVDVSKFQPNSETRAIAWMPFDRIVATAVNFRKPVYEKLFGFFKLHLKNRV